MFPTRSFVFAAILLISGAAIAFASLRGEPRRQLTTALASSQSRLVKPSELAEWIVTGRRDFVAVDMRTASEYAAGHVRGAVHCGTCHETKEAGLEAQRGESFVDLSKKLILYTETDAEPIVLPNVFHDNPRLYRLAGGFAAWRREVLAPVNFDGIQHEEEILAARKREAIRAFLSGERSVAASEAKLPVAPIRRRSPHKVAGRDEGC